MTKPHTTLSEAVRAMNRAKLLPIWDNDVPHKLHVELDVIFKALAALVEQHEAQEPVAWRYQRDTQSRPGVGDGEWRVITDCKMALDLQGKAPVGAPYIANSSYHCWEPLYAQPTLAATQAGDAKPVMLTKAELEDIDKAISAAMNPAGGMFFPRGWNVIQNKLRAAMFPTTTSPEDVDIFDDAGAAIAKSIARHFAKQKG